MHLQLTLQSEHSQLTLESEHSLTTYIGAQRQRETQRDTERRNVRICHLNLLICWRSARKCSDSNVSCEFSDSNVTCNLHWDRNIYLHTILEWNMHVQLTLDSGLLLATDLGVGAFTCNSHFIQNIYRLRWNMHSQLTLESEHSQLALGPENSLATMGVARKCSDSNVSFKLSNMRGSTSNSAKFEYPMLVRNSHWSRNIYVQRPLEWQQWALHVNVPTPMWVPSYPKCAGVRQIASNLNIRCYFATHIGVGTFTCNAHWNGNNGRCT